MGNPKHFFLAVSSRRPHTDFKKFEVHAFKIGGNSELILLSRKAVVSAEEVADVEDVVLCYAPGGGR